MKKSPILILLLLALFAPWAAQAQQELTVYEGTDENTYVPAYIYYFDEFARSQFVIPAADLSTMNGGTITSLKFYTTNNNVPYTTSVSADVYLMEVNYTTMTGLEPKANGTIVYQGYFDVETEGSGGSLTINFDTPYTYGGGNLLVGIENTQDGEWKQIRFLGQSVTGAAWAGYDSSSLDNVSGNACSFIPKSTFFYYPDGVSFCEQPTNLRLDDGPNTNLASITWDGGSGTYNVEYKRASDTYWTSRVSNYSAHGLLLTDLSANTKYMVRVQSVCDGGITSSWKTLHFNTSLSAPFVEAFASYGTLSNWGRYTGFLNDVMNGTATLTSGSIWGFGNNNDVFDNHAYINIYSATACDWLVTPQVYMQADCQLAFDLALTQYSGSQQPVTAGGQPDDRFVVLASTNGGSTWTILREWNNTGSQYVYDNIATMGERVSIDLSNYNTGTLKIAFYGESTGYNGDNNLHIDNVGIVKGDTYIFVSDGNWNDGSHWSTGQVPPLGSNVVILADAVIPAGYAAKADQVTIAGGSLTIADGGKLQHNTYGLVVTMKKNIAPYNDANGTDNYYLLSFPFDMSIAVPEAMTAAEGCDFYGFDPNYQDAEWRNNRKQTITTVGGVTTENSGSGTTGYLYANPEAAELSLTGVVNTSYYSDLYFDIKDVIVPYTEGSSNPSNGWALLGNPFTCDAYIYGETPEGVIPMDVMYYDANGDMQTIHCGPVAPMQGFFVKVTEPMHVKMSCRTYPRIPFYVDMGLPSGTLWASFNVGARAPDDYGDYFAWGETQPKDSYDWTNYHYCSLSSNRLIKYCNKSNYGFNGYTDNLVTLLPEDDAATANWGNDWRTPTEEEWQELIDNTTITWVTQNDVVGELFTAANGNSIFLPAAGYLSGSSLYQVGQGGNYWGTSHNTGSPSQAFRLRFNSSLTYETGYNVRNCGRSIRPVLATQPAATRNTVTAMPNVVEGGTLTNTQEGLTCTVTATANNGYVFTHWTENGNMVSTDATYTFTENGNRHLVANFKMVPTGAITGVFSVSDSKQVFFSMGNLQYKASTNTWRFATDQYSYMGSNNGSGSATYSNWIDIFGWGTSGYNHGAVCYQPWSTSTNNSDYIAYGNYSYNLYDQTGKADWGYNAISNGGNTENSGWRTLTHEEWEYVLNTRTTSSGLRYAKATVNSVKGLILLPNDWSTSYYSLSSTNTASASFSSNTISATDWNTLQQHGAVFLPAAGWRSGTGYMDQGWGSYWTSSRHSNNNYAYTIDFSNSSLSVTDASRCYGESVRLVIEPNNVATNYIDLGLPSGTLWATCNVGANSPEESGNFYAWGETSPKDWYDDSTYLHCNGSYQALTKYCGNSDYGNNGYTDNLNILLPEDDAATVTLGAGWRTPSREEWIELLNNTTSIWTTQNGVRGRRFTAANGNSIFLPAVGHYSQNLHFDDGSISYTAGQYWANSKKPDGSSPINVFHLLFDSSNNGYCYISQYCYQGLPIRAVRSAQPLTSTYKVTAVPSSVDAGMVTNVQQGQTCTLTATGRNGSTFVSWTENGEVVSTDATYTFTVTGHHNLVANFELGCVDLGLPSGLLWATCNVGANTPEEAGNYYAWGATQPDNFYTYSWNSYRYCQDSNGDAFTKYCAWSDYGGYYGYTDNLTRLQPMDDAATAVMGAYWHIPTQAEWSELCNHTTQAWTTQNGVKGIRFTASNGNSIFMPANGYYAYEEQWNGQRQGYYWTSDGALEINNAYSYNFCFYEDEGCDGNVNGECTVGFRYTGGSVRAVRSAQPNTAQPVVKAYSKVFMMSTAEGSVHNTQIGQRCILEAHAYSGYRFVHWAENSGQGPVVSTDATYTFTVTGDRTLYAVFVDANANGYGTVDLGLPSGNLWATCNVGATNDYDYGNYFAWGETHTKDTYSSVNYRYCNNNMNKLTKYCNDSEYGNNGYTDNLKTLQPGDDIATAFWGGNWRIPTKADWDELYSYTTRTWETIGGVQGMRYTASNGQSIFLPAAGLRDGNDSVGAGEWGTYWTSSLGRSNANEAECSSFNSNTISYSMLVGYDRYQGQTIRAVCAVQPNTTQYMVKAIPNIAAGGHVRTTQTGNTCTVKATPNDHYNFICWIENGTTVSTDATYSFVVGGNRNLVAYFQIKSFYINVSSSYSSAGTVTGSGSYTYGQSCTVTATVNLQNYMFANWTENGVVVSNNASYTFTVTCGRSLVANFVGYVDLGLPSGLLWATNNVGAAIPEAYGDYFAWGEITPKDEYSWDTYKYCFGSSNTLFKYCSHAAYGDNGFTDNLSTLLPEDDVATTNLGNGWRIPTIWEWQELISNTTQSLVSIGNGITGLLVTAPNGNSIFLPAANHMFGGSLFDTDNSVYYWSSSLDMTYPCFAKCFYWRSSSDFAVRYRCAGMPIRAVRAVSKDLP